MPTVTFKCPNCGAPLKFEPGEQLFACEFCASKFSEETLIEFAKEEEKKAEQKKEEYKEKEIKAKEDEKENGFHAAVYNCPSCGAEIVTDETTAATYCYFCHNPIVLSTRLTDEFKPELVLPFKLTDKDAKDNFMKWTKKKLFIPKDFFVSHNINNISGVYYPYWATDFITDASFVGEGEIVTYTSTSTEDITTTKYYSVERRGEVEFNNLMRSALKKEDRKLGDGIHPFNLNEAKPFSMAYLSGFIAEKRDIDKEEVRPSLIEEMKEYIPSVLTKGEVYTSLHGDSSMAVKAESFRYVLLPSWILTYKDHQGKLWHYAMNGQNGTLCGKLPIDRSKLLLFCALISLGFLAIGLLGGWLIW